MIQPVEIVNPLAVEAKQLGGDADRITRHQLALVVDMGFHHEGGTALAFLIIPPQAQILHERIGGVIERQHVIGDVHVAVVVNPLRQRHARVQAQGGLDPHGYYRHVR